MIGMINSQMTNSCAGEIGRTSRQREEAQINLGMRGDAIEMWNESGT